MNRFLYHLYCLPESDARSGLENKGGAAARVLRGRETLREIIKHRVKRFLISYAIFKG